MEHQFAPHKPPWSKRNRSSPASRTLDCFSMLRLECAEIRVRFVITAAIEPRAEDKGGILFRKRSAQLHVRRP